LRGQAHGDHGPLAQSSGKLVRILLRATLRLADRRLPQGRHGPFANGFLSQLRLVRANRFVNLPTDAHHRIQRGHRFLKNHGDLAPAQRAPLFLFQLG
jgi:hypothetical protein